MNQSSVLGFGHELIGTGGGGGGVADCPKLLWLRKVGIYPFFSDNNLTTGWPSDLWKILLVCNNKMISFTPYDKILTLIRFEATQALRSPKELP